MFPLAGQTAGLKFFVNTHGWPEEVLGKEIIFFLISNFFHIFLFPRATPGPSASM